MREGLSTVVGRDGHAVVRLKLTARRRLDLRKCSAQRLRSELCGIKVHRGGDCGCNVDKHDLIVASVVSAPDKV